MFYALDLIADGLISHVGVWECASVCFRPIIYFFRCFFV